ncbi:ras guanine nucleotide exchange factor B-like [Glossina fuscipes]|uniref:Ras guanine nucleotide exchange factor B-like n=1 Tax=Glossina fuscipes TaxID=7396 RepID=A0A8U0WE03_9MUSC|nr:ras guanine nucleotide exchange factor B-like [Glossina fuscipes]
MAQTTTSSLLESPLEFVDILEKPSVKLTGSAHHCSMSENNYTKPIGNRASIANTQDTLWHIKYTAPHDGGHLHHSSSQIYIERSPSAFSVDCGNTGGDEVGEPLAQYVVDYIGYPVPPPPHIKSVTTSGNQHSTFQSASLVESLSSSSSGLTAAVSGDNGGDRNQTLAPLEEKTVDDTQQQQTQPQLVPSQSAKRFKTVKKSKYTHHTDQQQQQQHQHQQQEQLDFKSIFDFLIKKR